MNELPVTDRTRVRRAADRGAFDRETINAVLDEALICHVGFVEGGQPYVIPTIHVRIDDRVYLHGSQASRMMRCLRGGTRACVTVTLLDGLVLARSAFHHSMNYRSVVILGAAREVTEPPEKERVLQALVEHVVPGRWEDSRQPTGAELNGTMLVSLPIEEASAKVRTGPPVDDDADYPLPHWAGVIPLTLLPSAPEPDPRLPRGTAVPAYVSSYARPSARSRPSP